MNITIDDMIDKYNICVNALDENKSCLTCENNNDPDAESKCANCYDMLLGFPVDPTNWEPKI